MKLLNVLVFDYITKKTRIGLQAKLSVYPATLASIISAIYVHIKRVGVDFTAYDLLTIY